MGQNFLDRQYDGLMVSNNSMVPFLIRLFSGVNAHMTSQVGRLSKRFLAYLEPVSNVMSAYCVAVAVQQGVLYVVFYK